MTVNRRGFTLVELLVVTVLGAITLGAVYRMLVVQQQAYTHGNARITVQQTARTAIQVLSSQLREVSATSGDLKMVATDSLTVRVPSKMGIVCSVDVPGQRIVVWQLGADAFAKGDSLLIFADGDGLTAADDAWGVARINGTNTSATCPVAWGAGTSVRLDIPSAEVAYEDVMKGGLVRAYETVTYGIHHVEGEWVLSRRREPDGPRVTLLNGLAAPADSGLVFTYYDDVGNAVLPADSAGRAAIERVEVRVRGMSRGRVGADREFYRDGLAMQLFLRNG